jgi:sRNA-binding protein
MRFYTRRPAYCFACKAGAARIDLAGQSVGIVTEDEAACAAEQLAQYHARAATIRGAARRKLVERAAAGPVAAPEPSTRASLTDLSAAAARRRAA